MAITLRGDSQSGKGSALTHAELDANFTTLGLAHGDTVADLDVSSIIINASSNEGRAMVVEATGGIATVAKFRRNYNVASPVSALVAHGEFSIAGAAEMGSGVWVTAGATDTTNAINLSGMQGQLEEFTSESDYKAKFQIYTWDTSNPTGNGALQPVLSASQTQVEVKNTGRMNITSGVAFNLAPVNYGDLPSSPQQGDIAYLLNDGAATPAYQNQPIYYEGSQWQYFNGSPVASS